ncbi:TPA: hypothetical protein TZN99_000219 [Streptococcus suis]|nr:hypothetical protein [Streptococcus suis]
MICQKTLKLIRYSPSKNPIAVEAETKKIQAQADADAEVIKAQGQAKANAELNNSISDNLIRMKEAEARFEHGWVEVITQGDVITNQE